MLVLWPVSSSLGPLIVFVIINGAANGGFFSTMPTVGGSVFGSRRVGVAMGMIVSGWAGGYLLGAPIAGYLLAAYGGEHSTLKAYHPAIFYASTMALGAAGLVGIVEDFANGFQELVGERHWLSKTSVLTTGAAELGST